MNDKPKRRGVDLAGILFFALAGSLLLNVALITGCVSWGASGNGGLDSPSEPSSASEIRQQCMREAAEAIGVSYAPGMTASDILSEIRMTVKPLEFSGRPLTEEEIKSASNMLTPEAEAALRQNQKFLSGLKGKKLKVVTSLQ